MNAYQRMHGLNQTKIELEWNLTAEFSAIVGADRIMSRPHPRRPQIGRTDQAAKRPPTCGRISRARILEDRTMKAHPAEAEVRLELVRRIRQQIQDGTYDTPERFEEALDRLAEISDRI